ncbi:hypothetical protein BLNAU_19110 [Blattamonas nauphoetae]|uniref:Uncharacterized protein n=1 Tax=Blattamonas nauphoetae TaxID=2049346 RepID=A0ABQ9X2H0_9EUKA|nr:hypothetical protein BLNAU_19110 [Blattamonas nauphoetae]
MSLPNSWPFSILALSPATPSHSPLPLPHHPYPPTPLFLSLTTHTLPLPSASPTPPTPSHSPLPLPSPHSAWYVLVIVVRSQVNARLDWLPPSLSLTRLRVLHPSSSLPSSPEIVIQTGREVQKDETGRGEQRHADVQKRWDTEDKLRSDSRKSESVSCRKETRKAGEDEWSGEGERKTRKKEGTTGRRWMLDKPDTSWRRGCERGKEEESEG